MISPNAWIVDWHQVPIICHISTDISHSNCFHRQILFISSAGPWRIHIGRHRNTPYYQQIQKQIQFTCVCYTPYYLHYYRSQSKTMPGGWTLAGALLQPLLQKKYDPTKICPPPTVTDMQRLQSCNFRIQSLDDDKSVLNKDRAKPKTSSPPGRS